VSDQKNDLPVVVRRDHESFEAMLNRFSRAWRASHIREEVRERERFLSRREKRLLKLKRAARRGRRG
jgi:ribosomal protein S21